MRISGLSKIAFESKRPEEVRGLKSPEGNQVLFDWKQQVQRKLSQSGSSQAESISFNAR